MEWSSRFDHGYSQIIDWFWKLHDMARTEAGRARFGHHQPFNYHGLLVISRSDGLSDLEKQRLDGRRKRVVVDSRIIQCPTLDELYEDLEFQLDRYAAASLVDSGRLVVDPPRVGKRLPRKFRRKS